MDVVAIKNIALVVISRYIHKETKCQDHIICNIAYVGILIGTRSLFPIPS